MDRPTVNTKLGVSLIRQVYENDDDDKIDFLNIFYKVVVCFKWIFTTGRLWANRFCEVLFVES
jgi:hypothetical protein